MYSYFVVVVVFACWELIWFQLGINGLKNVYIARPPMQNYSDLGN